MPSPLLITNLVNVRYLTGLEMTAGIVLITRSKTTLFVDARYIEKATKECKRGIAVLSDEKLPMQLKKYKRVFFEADNLTVDRLTRWKKRFRGTKFVPSIGVIEQQRRAKKKSEVEATKKACRITDRILRQVPTMLKNGIREADVAWKIADLAHQYGADDMAFETIVAFGPHTSRPHHRAGKRRLKRGDLVQIDMGVQVDGYCSDCSRMFFTKKPTKEQKEVHNILVRIVKETTAMAKTGTLNTALDRYARQQLKRHKLDHLFLHSLGHGVGLEVHEGVHISSRAKKKQKLLRNEVITTEPGIYKEGQWGMRVEDTVLVTRSGGKRLTGVQY